MSLKGLSVNFTQTRSNGDFEAADRMRKELEKKGILVEDTPTGSRWKRVKS